MREYAYNNEKIIEWDDRFLTVTEASQQWQYYSAENSEKAALLQSLIIAAKQKIRKKYSD